MITPKELEIKDEKDESELMSEIEKMIDNSIMDHHGRYPRYEVALINDELPENIRNKIGMKYMSAGWTHVYHRTSSENGKRSGLTRFIFSTHNLDDVLENYTKIKDLDNSQTDHQKDSANTLGPTAICKPISI